MIGFIIGAISVFGLFLFFPETFQKIANFMTNLVKKDNGDDSDVK